MNNVSRVMVGIGVMILREGKILLRRHHRRNAPRGEYEFPGGHLEYGESFEECARREVREECGLEIKNIRFLFLGNFLNYSKKHYVQVQLLADWKKGEPMRKEKNRGEEWGWYDAKKLPHPLFKMTELAIQSYKTGRAYYDL